MKISITQSKIRRILILLFWIFVWGIVAGMIQREIYLPSPLTTFKALFQLLWAKDTYLTILYSSYRTILGFFLSCLWGILLGYFCGIYSWMYDLLKPAVSIIRTVPVMSIIIIALLWFKDTHVPIFVAFLMCFPLIWTSTVTGIHNMDPKLLEMCKVYRIKRIRVIRSVYLYAVAPYIQAGMISALGISWKVTSAAEVLSLPKYSIGRFLYDAKVYLEIPNLFAWTIIIIALSYVFERILTLVFRRSSY